MQLKLNASMTEKAGLHRRGLAIAAAAVLALTPLQMPRPAQAQEAPGSPQAAATDTATPPPKETAPAGAPPKVEPAAPPHAQQIAILLAREWRKAEPPISLLDLPNADDGIGGAKLAIADNNTTGHFMKQDFSLEVVDGVDAGDLVAKAVKAVDGGTQFVVVDAEPATLLAIADALKGKEALVINAGAADDRLREEDCRANVVHTLPTRTMLTDALGQYLVWKKWNNWFMIQGPQENDKLYAEALRRTAKKFGGKIVEERTFTYDSSSRRTDGGFEQVQQQIPTFTQNAKSHDVVLVADEGNLFGEYLPYRTWDARPVAGTAGLVPMSWHPALELWGGTQFQNRFRRLMNRIMKPIDYNVWMGIRLVGEAASRTKAADFKTMNAYIRSDKFELAAFKGVKTTIRNWNGQLRQPVLVATPKLLVTVSPQPGFLHQTSELDTLGIDRPESKCKAYAQ